MALLVGIGTVAFYTTTLSTKALGLMPVRITWLMAVVGPGVFGSVLFLQFVVGPLLLQRFNPTRGREFDEAFSADSAKNVQDT